MHEEDSDDQSVEIAPRTLVFSACLDLFWFQLNPHSSASDT